MFKKIQKVSLNPRAKKAITLTMCLAVCMCMFCVMASAAETDYSTVTTPVQAGQAFFDIMSEQINIGTILAMIGISASTCLGIFLAVFTIKKVGRAALSALRGRFKIG